MRKYTYIEKEVLLSTLLFQSGFSYNGHFLAVALAVPLAVPFCGRPKDERVQEFQKGILDSLFLFLLPMYMLCRFYPGRAGKTLGVRLTETTLISSARGKNDDGVFKSNHLASSFDSAPPKTPAESTLEKLPTLHNHSSIFYCTGVTKLLGVYNLISCPRLFTPSIKRASLIISFPLHTFRNCIKLQRLLPVTVCRNNTGKLIINGSTPLWKKKRK